MEKVLRENREDNVVLSPGEVMRRIEASFDADVEQLRKESASDTWRGMEEELPKNGYTCEIREVLDQADADNQAIEEGLKKLVASRVFASGATRSPLADKLQYSGFISPIVLKRYAEYMHKHRLQENGELRDADNWQKGIPDESALDSMLRHTMDVWLHQRGFEKEMTESLLESLCAVIFNASVMILNLEKENVHRD